MLEAGWGASLELPHWQRTNVACMNSRPPPQLKLYKLDGIMFADMLTWLTTS